MDILLAAAVGNVEGADYIASYCGFLVVFAPIHIGSTCDTGAVEDVTWFNPCKLVLNSFTVFHASCSGVEDPSLLLQLLHQQSCDPAIATPYQEHLVSRAVHSSALQ